MGFVDIHSHILPYMDDGAQDFDQALQMLDMAWEEGITHMIATPHYKQGRYRADTQAVLQQVEELQGMAQDQGIPVQIYPGTEVFYRGGLEEKLDRGKLWTLNGTEYVLVEFAPLEEYSYIRNAVDEMLGMGYKPVAAHVERYRCFLRDADRVRELKTMGCRIQVNSGSVAGEFGYLSGRFTRGLIQKELVDYLGTDAHDLNKRRPLMKKCAEFLLKKCSQEYAYALLFGNAMTDLLPDESTDAEMDK